ncbi:hypothetical protein VTK73DRAFT_3596 [Phialemonium thermophilum]|uniref:Uncharacterized protein n=1 Tax=Phialemonium thermophilum TaxID=223376 RepID=A0ABR3VI81_9PEZI
MQAMLCQVAFISIWIGPRRCTITVNLSSKVRASLAFPLERRVQIFVHVELQLEGGRHGHSRARAARLAQIRGLVCRSDAAKADAPYGRRVQRRFRSCRREAAPFPTPSEAEWRKHGLGFASSDLGGAARWGRHYEGTLLASRTQPIEPLGYGSIRMRDARDSLIS